MVFHDELWCGRNGKSGRQAGDTAAPSRPGRDAKPGDPGGSPGCGDKNVFVPPPPPKVTVSQPVTQPVTDYLEFTGNTQAINTVQLKARVEGYLEKVFFKDGDRVKKNQLLFLIQQNTYEAKLKQAEAEILSQKAKLFHAKTEYDRYTKLVAQKAAAQTEVDNWLYQRDAAQAALISAEAQRDLARLNLGYTKVTSPFDGRIDRRLKDPGNLVGAGEATLLANVDQIDLLMSTSPSMSATSWTSPRIPRNRWPPSSARTSPCISLWPTRRAIPTKATLTSPASASTPPPAP